MNSLILMAAMTSPDQCPAGAAFCPLKAAAVVATAPARLVAAGNSCGGRQSRFSVAPRAVKGGCGGIQVAATALPPPATLPLPMTAPPPPPVVKKTTTTTVTTTEAAPCPATVAVVAVKPKVDVYRRAPVRTHMANRSACPQ